MKHPDFKYVYSVFLFLYIYLYINLLQFMHYLIKYNYQEYNLNLQFSLYLIPIFSIYHQYLPSYYLFTHHKNLEYYGYFRLQLYDGLYFLGHYSIPSNHFRYHLNLISNCFYFITPNNLLHHCISFYFEKNYFILLHLPLSHFLHFLLLEPIHIHIIRYIYNHILSIVKL